MVRPRIICSAPHLTTISVQSAHLTRPGHKDTRKLAGPPGESGCLRNRAQEQGHQRSLTCSGASALFPAAGPSPDRVGNAAPASVPALAVKGGTSSQRRRQAGFTLFSSCRPLSGSQPVLRCLKCRNQN
ncbi:hypothetical protein NDU88_006304 [Pleurodeles waltl]|uniref:Uncharacterized protein n=1 Tax=Pleurodeles waltl TaxID=8319 RepID=A0AAV7TD39_PLEWA|nr:hypothetical protein NDU88_006304 [Pleurodeles waltl]